MIDLDKRILDGKKPLTPFDEIDSKFIGTDCYFSDKASDFGDLSNCQIGSLLRKDEATGVFSATKNNSYAVFNYCLPAEWVSEKKEQKYRPFTGIEFAEKFDLKLGGIIRLKNIISQYRYKTIFTGYRWYGDDFEVLLNGSWMNMITLLNTYEYDENNEWKPFGVEVKE